MQRSTLVQVGQDLPLLCLQHESMRLVTIRDGCIVSAASEYEFLILVVRDLILLDHRWAILVALFNHFVQRWLFKLFLPHFDTIVAGLVKNATVDDHVKIFVIRPSPSILIVVLKHVNASAGPRRGKFIMLDRFVQL